MKGRHHRFDPNQAAPGADTTGEEPIVSLTGHLPEPLLTPEIVSVLKRLRVILGEAIEQGRRLGLELTGPRLAKLCDELLREAREPGYKPSFDDSVEGFFLGGVFDDLVQQPSNIFSQVTGTDGKEYYVPLTASQWIACLEALRFSLLPHQ
ncbi:hypothetical protein ACXR0O_09300 [Verrucomicrobiota bacterium sgz303538]